MENFNADMTVRPSLYDRTVQKEIAPLRVRGGAIVGIDEVREKRQRQLRYFTVR